jgi:hypothetical protein
MRPYEFADLTRYILTDVTDPSQADRKCLDPRRDRRFRDSPEEDSEDHENETYGHIVTSGEFNRRLFQLHPS